MKKLPHNWHPVKFFIFSPWFIRGNEVMCRPEGYINGSFNSWTLTKAFQNTTSPMSLRRTRISWKLLSGQGLKNILLREHLPQKIVCYDIRFQERSWRWWKSWARRGWFPAWHWYEPRVQHSFVCLLFGWLVLSSLLVLVLSHNKPKKGQKWM